MLMPYLIQYISFQDDTTQSRVILLHRDKFDLFVQMYTNLSDTGLKDNNVQVLKWSLTLCP